MRALMNFSWKKYLNQSAIVATNITIKQQLIMVTKRSWIPKHPYMNQNVALTRYTS